MGHLYYYKVRSAYKLKVLNPGNKTGQSYGLNVPKQIAEGFSGTLFKISISGNAIIYESGCHPKIETKPSEVLTNV